MGNHDYDDPRYWSYFSVYGNKLMVDAERHRLLDAKMRRTGQRTFTYWNEAIRRRFTWDAEGLDYWLTQSVMPKDRPMLGAIAEVIWG